MDLVCFSHFIQNDKATSADFLFRSVPFFVFSSLGVHALIQVRLCQDIDAFFPHRQNLRNEKKERKTKRDDMMMKKENGAKEKCSVVFVDVSPSFLISHVNFHCMQQKRKNGDDDDDDAETDRRMARCARADERDFHASHNLRIVRKSKKETERRAKAVAKTINNNSSSSKSLKLLMMMMMVMMKKKKRRMIGELPYFLSRFFLSFFFFCYFCSSLYVSTIRLRCHLTHHQYHVGVCILIYVLTQEYEIEKNNRSKFIVNNDYLKNHLFNIFYNVIDTFRVCLIIFIDF